MSTNDFPETTLEFNNVVRFVFRFLHKPEPTYENITVIASQKFSKDQSLLTNYVASIIGEVPTKTFLNLLLDAISMPYEQIYKLSSFVEEVPKDLTTTERAIEESPPISNKTATPAYVKLLGKITPDLAAKDPRTILPALFDTLENDRTLKLTPTELTSIFSPLTEKILAADADADSLYRILTSVFDQTSVDQNLAKNLSNQLLIYHLAHPNRTNDQMASYLNSLLLKESQGEHLPEQLGTILVEEINAHEQARVADPDPHYESVKKYILEEVENSKVQSDVYLKHFVSHNDLDIEKALQGLTENKAGIIADINKLLLNKNLSPQEIEQLRVLYKQKRSLENIERKAVLRKAEISNLRHLEESKIKVTPLENELVAQFVAHGLAPSEARSAAREFINSGLATATQHLSSFFDSTHPQFGQAKSELFSDALSFLKTKFPQLKGFKLNVGKFDQAFNSITYFRNLLDNPSSIIQVFSQKLIQDFTKQLFEKYISQTAIKAAGQQLISQALAKFAASEIGKKVLSEAVKKGVQLVAKEGLKKGLQLATSETIIIPILLEIGDKILGKLRDLSSWVQRKIKENAPMVATAIGATIGGLIGALSGIGAAPTAVVGGIVGGVSSIVGNVITGTQSMGLTQFAASANRVLTALVVETAADSVSSIAVAVLATPIVIALFLFIINSSAYVVPQATGGIGGAIPACWPTRGRITQDPCATLYGAGGSHSSGIDMNSFDIAPEVRGTFGTEIYATHDGTILSTIDNASDTIGYGNHVIIASINGSFYTLYAHLLEYSVSQGQVVKAGDQIGTMDCTGTGCGNTTGDNSHLHYELRTGGSSSSVNQCDLVDFVPPGWGINGTTDYSSTCYANESGGKTGP